MSYYNHPVERRKIHKELIKVQDLPCAYCGGRLNRQVHRINKDGDYTEANCLVLCSACHRKVHNRSKFVIGDRVVLNGRAPKYVTLARHRPRTIIGVYYSRERQCNYYQLGSNARGECSGYGNSTLGYTERLFRSYELEKPRHYHFHRHYKKQIQSTCETPQSTRDSLGDKVLTDYTLKSNFLIVGQARYKDEEGLDKTVDIVV